MHTQNVTATLADLYRPVREDLERAADIFDREIRSDLAFVNDFCDTVRSYRGKMLRPALLLLTARAAGTVTPDHAVLAAVIEMVHMATLVHDDVLDDADERRGRPTIATLSGNVAAVLLGDYLISHAYHLCSSLDDQHAARCVADATNTVCEGELLQNHHRADPDVTDVVYHEIIRRKTGALTAAACELGAHYAGCDRSVIESMRDFGMAAGVAFQIVDDVLDITGDASAVGKTLGRDLDAGKLTLPTIHCLAHACPETRAKLRAMILGDSPRDPGRLGDHLAETGSIDYAMRIAQTHVAEAQRRLHALPPGEARTALETLAEFITHRRF